MDYSSKLRAWYRKNARELPWRTTSDPYAIWLSEVILQQTRVAQGLPYFEKFISTYPKVNDLANAPEDDLMKLWEGLGYYSRARNLHKGAKYIAENGCPTTHDEWLNVPGVGPYTAAAISSFSLNERYPVVDGNVNRVIARAFGVQEAVNSTKGKAIIYELASELIANQPSAEHNQAIMELGALVCTPHQPTCVECPWKDNCIALSQNTIDQLPVKEKKTKVQEVELNYTAVLGKEGMYLQKRGTSGIWKSLYEFIPKSLSEITGSEHPSQVDTIKHLLSHRKLHIHIETLLMESEMPLTWKDYQLYSWDEIKRLGFPKPLRSWLDNKLLTLQLGSED